MITKENEVNKVQQTQMKIGIHQLPKSPWRFLLLVFQHVFAMFGANILVPILVNQAAGFEVIPLQVAFLCSGVGTIIYLVITGFNTPIYLGSSFAYLGGMTTLYASQGQITGGYNIFFSLMMVGLIYVILAMIIYFTKSAKSIKKLLSPVVVGPAILLIGWGLMTNAASDAFLNPQYLEGGVITSSNIDMLWLMISISLVTFIAVVVAMIFMKGIWKMIPILFGLLVGVVYAIVVWGIAKGVGNTEITNLLFNKDNSVGLQQLLDPSSWKWYPDVTLMWKQNISHHTGFRIEVYLALVPLAIVTLSEHIGDHINIGNLTGNDFVEGKPGLHRTLMGDGIATIVSAALGGPANTSYGENTSVISITKVASVWVIFGAACTAILISFIAPISMLLNAIPQAVLGGVEIILYTMIGINGLRILINAKLDMFDPKNIIIIALLVACGLGGTVLVFLPSDVLGSQISLSGTGVGVILAVILNAVIPSKKDEADDGKTIIAIDFTPSDFMRIGSIRKNKPNKVQSQSQNQNYQQGERFVRNKKMINLVYPYTNTSLSAINYQELNNYLIQIFQNDFLNWQIVNVNKDPTHNSMLVNVSAIELNNTQTDITLNITGFKN